MKRWKKLLIMLAALAVLAGGYKLAEYFAGQNTSTVEEKVEKTAVAEISAEDITSLAWGDVKLTKTEAGWAWADDSAFPLDEGYPEQIALGIASLTASRTIENYQSLTDYGLDEPAFKLTVGLADGAEINYLMGDENALTGEYYLKTDWGAAVYTVADDIADSYGYALYDMAQTEGIPAMDDKTRIVISDKLDQSYVSEPDYYAEGYNWFSAEGAPADEGKMESIITALDGLTWSSAVEYNAADLSEYGLDAPTQISVYYGDGAEFQLLVSDTGYAKLPGSGMVYIIPASTATQLCAATDASVRSLDVLEVDWAAASEVNFEYAGALRTLLITDGAYTLDGVELPDDSILTSIDALAAASALDENAQPGASVLKIALKLGEATIRLDFSEYDADNYLLTMLGDSKLLVPADSIDKLVRQIKNA